MGRERVECEIEWSVGERGVRREGKDMGVRGVREWGVTGEREWGVRGEKVGCERGGRVSVRGEREGEGESGCERKESGGEWV